MQNRGALWVFIILLSLACLWQLSFSFATKGLESEADLAATAYADSVVAVPGNEALDHDSIHLIFANGFIQGRENEVVFLGYTYKESKEREVNLGLDLRGGMAVTLEVDIPALVENLSGNNQDPSFTTAIVNARKRLTSSNKDFISLFDEEFKKSAPNASLAAIFSSQDNSAIFPRESTNDEVIQALREQSSIALNNTEKILRTRIDKFGVAQPSIQKQTLSNRIQIELPGVKDKERVRNVLQSTANLEFWETFDNAAVYLKISESNDKLAAMLKAEKADPVSPLDTLTKVRAEDASVAPMSAIDSLVGSSSDSKEDSLADALVTAGDSLDLDSTKQLSPAESLAKSPLLNNGRLQLNIMNNQVVPGSVVGYAAVGDTAIVGKLLRMAPPKSPDPSQVLRLAWSGKPTKMSTADGQERDFLALYALRAPRGGKPKLDGAYVTDARQDFDMKGDAEVSMQMNPEGAQKWKLMTGENVGKQVAIVLDGYVVSAPTVMSEIGGGRSSISMGGSDNRNTQLEEATDLANILKAGALPAPARIIDESVVGPTLGSDNINGGIISFSIALVVIVLVMMAYYARAGWIADIALLANVFFLIGCMASFQATLTLPGIAGIVLTLGMAVDANVLLNERIREELKRGRMLKVAVDNAFKFEGALSAIVDSNITTFVTGVILFYFGSGPIRGFATTLMLGIATSLFTAIFISRLITTRRLEKGKSISYWHEWSKNIFDNANFNFMGARKWFYIGSIVVIGFGIFSIATRGFNMGVDFTGGRTYVVKFDQPVDLEVLRKDLGSLLSEGEREYSVGAKTYGGEKQVKITTNYLIDDPTRGTDALVDARVREGLALVGPNFQVMESRKVDATISDDIKSQALTAVGFALLFMFIYIGIRFNNWRFGVGALVGLVHDTLFVLGLYSVLWGIVGFSLEIDETFIAVILTVIGYSINDTVVVFDRVREQLRDHKRDPVIVVFNNAINSTLSRTLNTGITTLLVLVVIFIFGGVSIQGFAFGLFAGVLTGTYSSIFIASAVAVDLYKDNQTVPVGKKLATA